MFDFWYSYLLQATKTSLRDVYNISHAQPKSNTHLFRGLSPASNDITDPSNPHTNFVTEY